MNDPLLPVDPSSETGRLILALDWSQTTLGPREGWPEHLRTALSILQGSRFPMGLLWGPERVQLYNDAYLPIFGDKHPRSLGQRACDSWREIWPLIDPMFAQVEQQATSTWSEHQLMLLERRGGPEESYFTFSYSPVRGPSGRIDGIFVTALETTDQVVALRRERTLKQMLVEILESGTEAEAIARCAAPLSTNPEDLPFARLYLQGMGGPRCVAAHGEADRGDEAWPLREVMASGEPVVLPGAGRNPAAVVMAIRPAGDREICGVLVAGISPRRPYDAAYAYFLQQVTERFGTAVARVRMFQRSEQERIALLERLADGFYALDRQWRFTYVNAAAEGYIGQPRAALLGRSILEALPKFRASPAFERYERALREQTPAHFEIPGIVKEGRREVHAYPSSEGLSVLFRDITAQRQAEEAQARLTEIIEATSDVVATFSVDGTLQYLNEAGRRLCGPEPQTGPRRSLTGFFAPEVFADTIRPAIDAAIRTGTAACEASLCATDGRTLPASLVLVAHRASEGPAGFVSMVARDLSARREAELRLRASEERYRTVFKRNPVPMWLFDLDSHRIVAVNAAATQSYGYTREEFLALRVEDLRPSEEVPGMLAALAAQPPDRAIQGTFVHRYKDGSLHQVEATCNLVTVDGERRMLVVANDVTEHKRLEEQLRQAQKLEAVGQLAGGVAHDFNNLLAVISSNLRMALEELQRGSELRDAVADAADATERAISLTRQLLTFSRRQAVELEVLELNGLVADAERMLRRLIREDIVLVTRLASTLPGLRADRGQLEQVLVNLVVNARDAMPAGGELVVETGEVRADGRRWVQLSVRDSGCGMDEATRQRIFEPFFTTKPVGQGTGLGLATVYGIVEQLGGRIELETSPGAGTTFRILFPAVVEAPVEARRPDGAAGHAPRGTERILVVEDEAIVRGAIRRVLERHGYQVQEAQDGEDALAQLASREGHVDLVLSDLVMPKLGGRALAARVREQYPGLPVVLMSGYDREASTSPDGALEPVDVAKPFDPDELLRCLRRKLDTAAAARVSRTSPP